MTKTKIKKFRLTEQQQQQLDKYIEKENVTFSDFIHSLIEREIMQEVHTVTQHMQENLRQRTKIKTVVEVVKQYQKTDPNLLLQLAKIGNNINQIARVLNSIQNSSTEKHQQINFIELFLTLNNIKFEIENILPSIPKISRQPQATLIKKFTSISLGLGGNNAH